MGASLAGTSVPEVAALLRREQLNSYGVLAAHGRGGERKLRGSGVYAQASLINHECAPNVARYDNFDSDRPDSTSIHFRAMHDLPAGTELAQSYCPLNWDFQTRQRQCRDVYGFVCCCPRCQTEQTEDLAAAAGGSQCSSDGWQTDDEGGSAAGSGAASDDGREADDAAAEEEMLDAESEQVGPLPAGEEPPLDPTYLHLFLLKYVCPRRDCFGTLAPAAPGSGSHECNVCGRQRSEAQFMSSLESKQRR